MMFRSSTDLIFSLIDAGCTFGVKHPAEWPEYHIERIPAEQMNRNAMERERRTIRIMTRKATR
jgi:hypothetical protein